MRKINLDVVARNEAFEAMNSTDNDLKPFWETAQENYDNTHCSYDDDEDLFYIKQAQDFYDKYLKGHSWDDILASKELQDAYDFWSDLFKDAWGYRPRFI